MTGEVKSTKVTKFGLGIIGNESGTDIAGNSTAGDCVTGDRSLTVRCANKHLHKLVCWFRPSPRWGLIVRNAPHKVLRVSVFPISGAYAETIPA